MLSREVSGTRTSDDDTVSTQYPEGAAKTVGGLLFHSLIILDPCVEIHSSPSSTEKCRRSKSKFLMVSQRQQ